MQIRGVWLAVPLSLLTGLVFVGSGDTSVAIEEKLWRIRTLGKAFYENPTTQAQAVEQFKLAWEMNPKSAVDRLNYGLSLLRNGQTKEGMTELEAVQKQDPSIPHSWFNLGIEYKKLGESEKAIAQLEQMAKLEPKEAITHYNLGVLYKTVGRVEDANKKFELAGQLDPNLAAPHFQLFNTHRQAGRMDEARKELALFQELKKKHEEAGTGNEDVEWSFFSEIYETIEPKRFADASAPAGLQFTVTPLPGKADAATARMNVVDLENDGTPDLIVSSSAGVVVLRKGESESAQPALAELKGVTRAFPADFNNDTFVDLLVITATGPKLFRNEAGVFKTVAEKLPEGRFEIAGWVDYDHDYDLDLVLFGEKNFLLRNQGEAGFADRTADFPFQPGKAVDIADIRIIPDTKTHDLVVSYTDRAAVLYKDRLAGRYDATTVPEIPAGARGFTTADLDNDSVPDLAWEGGAALNRQTKFETLAWPAKGAFAVADLENRSLLDVVTGKTVLRSQGQGKWSEPSSVASLPAAAVWAWSDFDGDGRTDAAALTADGKLHRVANKTALKNGWVRVRLKGVKNLKLAPGAEVEIKTGSIYQKKIYEGVPLLFGVRDSREIDTIRITWPNGLIQNEMKQKAGAVYNYEEAQRLSGSCPMIFTWNGREFEYITDVLGVAPLGASSGDGSYFPTDHDEYIWISGERLKEKAGEYEVRITEELSEISYLDQVTLIAVDHPSSVEVYPNEKWKSPPYPEFRLFGATKRVYPVKALEDGRHDALARVSKKDRAYPDQFPRDLSGAAKMHTLDLDFGRAARDNRAVLVLAGWVDWADGSTFLSQAQSSKTGLMPPSLQVKDPQGKWVTVIEDMGMPAGKPKTIAVDLTGKFLSDSREVRIVTNLCVYWDEIFLSEDSGAPIAALMEVAAKDVQLRFRGFSKALIHPERLQPEEFFYPDPAPSSMWNPTPGLYTRYGDVTGLLDTIDDKFVIMGSGDEAVLRFDAKRMPALPAGWRRDYMLKVDGWAKDRDANTAFSQTVEPLPFHGMSGYPYASSERYPDTPEHRDYRLKYNTRPALKLVRPLNAGGTATQRPGAAE